jgi:uncharacterized membrane protein YvbJ
MWICKQCNQKNEDSFDSCWKCGTNNQMIMKMNNQIIMKLSNQMTMKLNDQIVLILLQNMFPHSQLHE